MNDTLFNPYFIILNVAFLISIGMVIFTLRKKDKNQLHKIFTLTIITVIIWELGQLLDVYWRALTGDSQWIFVCIYFFGMMFLPPCLLFMGIIYNKRSIKFRRKYLIAFLPATINFIVLATSPLHNIFMIHYSPNSSEVVMGFYFWVHNFSSYSMILVGLGFILYTSLKSSGFFSKQSIMVIIAIILPFSLNIIVSYFRVESIPIYITPVSFFVSMLLFALSIMRFNFLNVMPVALNNIFDQISDGVIVLDGTMKIIEFNRAAENLFNTGDIELKRNIQLKEVLNQNILSRKEERLFYMQIRNTINTNNPVFLERAINLSEKRVHVSIEVSNVIVKGTYYSTIILIKDITELKRQMEEIQRSQEILMEKERLASLGNLIGGIAHNLKTPIMTISGVSKTLEALGEEYRDSIDDPEVTKEDHREIASEIIDWSHKVSPYCSYMSEMISAVKGQAVQLSTDNSTIFTLYELLSRINILMKFELKKFHCDLRQDLHTSIYTELKGDLSILVQVFNNIITNAIQSYEGKEGVIDFKITSQNGKILFVIADKGIGIRDSIKNKLFREMVTTKGKEGTGLGMYMAYSTIRGHFNGSLTFESEMGKGTSFFIEIPIYKEVADAPQ